MPKVIAIRYLSKSEQPDFVYDLNVSPRHQYTLENGQIVHNSGKDYVLSRTLDGHGLTEINSDKAFEFLMDKNNLDMRMPKNEKERRDVVRGKAKNMTELRQRLSLFGRNGLIINGTGDDLEKISKIKERLENIGYETSGIMVNTADEVSKQRNIERGQRGGRTVPEEIRADKWQKVQNSRPELAKMFGDDYSEFDNSEDLRTADPQIVQEKEKELMDLYKGVQKFVNKPPKNPNAKLWVASELEKKDTLKVDPTKEVTPHKGSKAAEEARQMGLSYFGFGRYGKKDKVTHRSVHDKLVEVQPQTEKNTEMPVAGTSMSRPSKKMNEEFQEMVNEEPFISEKDIEILEKKEDKYITDKQEKPRVFMLRSAAAKEAHTRNGFIVKTEKGYVVKLKEENQNVQMVDKFFQNEKRNTSNLYEEFNRTQRNYVATSGKESFSEEAHTQKIQNKEKITFAKIRENQKEKIKESIDKGIESGISMSGSGESTARDSGEKIKKTTGKASQVVEKDEIEEMSGANMNTRQIHQHLKKHGWELNRTSGSHDVYTHEKAKHNIAVPRHKKLKAPLVIGILKSSKQLNELTGDETTASIGDKKEDELKKMGVSLTSFKKKNFV